MVHPDKKETQIVIVLVVLNSNCKEGKRMENLNRQMDRYTDRQAERQIVQEEFVYRIVLSQARGHDKNTGPG